MQLSENGYRETADLTCVFATAGSRQIVNADIAAFGLTRSWHVRLVCVGLSPLLPPADVTNRSTQAEPRRRSAPVLARVSRLCLCSLTIAGRRGQMSQVRFAPSLYEMRNFSPGQVWAGFFVGGRRASDVHCRFIRTAISSPAITRTRRGRVADRTHDLEQRRPAVTLARPCRRASDRCSGNCLASQQPVCSSFVFGRRATKLIKTTPSHDGLARPCVLRFFSRVNKRGPASVDIFVRPAPARSRWSQSKSAR